MASKYYENKARRAWWQVHVDAWQRSGLPKSRYCQQHGLLDETFTRWLRVLADEEALRVKRELAREALRERRRCKHAPASKDTKNRAVRAYWAMHVEALRWSGMPLQAYAKSLGLSVYSLGRWRLLIERGEVEEDWRALLHPSARANLSTSAKPSANEPGAESGLTDGEEKPAKRARRTFSSEEKQAIVTETERPGETVTSVARRHDIVTSMVFRWRAEMGLGKRERARLAAVRLAGASSSEPLVLHDLVPPSDGMAAVDLGDGRRVFAPIGSDPEAVRRQVAKQENAR